jgi:hypothetical protein
MKNLPMKKLLMLAVLVLLLVGMATPKKVFAKPLAAGISTSVDSQAKSGIPGSVITYTLTINNTAVGAVDEILTLTATTAGGWPIPTIVPSAFTLLAGTSQLVTINVPIPSTATTGQNDVATILITGSSESIDPIQLTTTAKAPAVSGRPIIAISSYSSTPNPIKPYQEFTLSVVFENRGQSTAYNVIVNFEGTDLYPRNTGGVSTVANLDAGGKVTFTQTFLAGGNLTWEEVASIKSTAVYSDGSGQSYTEPFNLTLGITAPVYYAATATPKAQIKPQLVITGIEADVDPIQPGSIFTLKLTVTNLGMVDAKNVTMVLGGGVTSPEQSGTQQPGGVSGSSGDLTNFAPLGNSNLVFIGDILQGATISTTQKLVTNVSTQPGAYTLKVSYVYEDGKGNRLVDDQVITLLVYSLPQVEISFYRDPGGFTVGMPNTLPIQVTNLGKKTNVLGNMKVTAENADLTNNISLVGALDPGGYYTLDTEVIPQQEGPVDVVVTINYTDDFNQPRFITNTLSIDVLPAPEITEGLEGQNGSGLPTDIPVEQTPETFWSKLGRFFKGLFGLGSGKDQNTIPGGEIVPTEQFIPAKPGKG